MIPCTPYGECSQLSFLELITFADGLHPWFFNGNFSGVFPGSWICGCCLEKRWLWIVIAPSAL